MLLNVLEIIFPLLGVGLVSIPFILAFKRNISKSIIKRRIYTHIGLFFGLVGVLAVYFLLFSPTLRAAEGEESLVASITGTLAQGLGFLAAALSTGLSAVGAGIAVGNAAPAAIGALSENEKNFGKAMIFVVLGEGIAIYGLLISILIINKL
ncbi:MAG: ATP synthase subunit C [Acholeplasmatales bacterium]|jgi:V/A-type H+-transporting ATPase subunit K|nr:ATP synthase subunit C [Acholeplasmatales bacterium]